MRTLLKISWAVLLTLTALPLYGTTWYVRRDGGSRFSVNVPGGQCDGMADVAYSGKGANQHCAFNDVRYLWTDASYTANPGAGAPAWGWIGKGGDTFIIRDGPWRIGQSGSGGASFGLHGNQYAAGAPQPISGTAGQHTRILGEHYASCHTQSMRTELFGGYGVGSVLNMAGVSYVDVACLDITDHSSCGRATQKRSCNPDTDDYATNGITWSNTSTHDTLTDVRIHGLASAGMFGPTGDGVIMKYVDLLGNASSGWNADASDKQTGSGTLLVQNYNISWNGCAEEYPITHRVPYGDCTDQNSGGYGDGFGTATELSSPGWVVHFDQGVVSYNTQDGLDALHLIGNGSSMTVTRTLAYGNMGQQIKVGGASGTASNNLIVGNCTAMHQAIPGTPPLFNARLSLFCRAGDGATLLTIGPNTLLRFDNNTIYTAGAVAVEIECDNLKGPCDATSRIDVQNNIFVGFRNDVAHGYDNGSMEYPTPIYNGTDIDFFGNKGSRFTHNVTYHPRQNWVCPAPHEKAAHCGDPQLADRTWHLYNFGNMAPAKASSSVVGSGVPIPDVTTDYEGKQRPSTPSRGALEFNAETATAVDHGVVENISYLSGITVHNTNVHARSALRTALKYFAALALLACLGAVAYVLRRHSKRIITTAELRYNSGVKN